MRLKTEDWKHIDSLPLIQTPPGTWAIILCWLILVTGSSHAQGLNESFVPAVGLPEAWSGAMLEWDYDQDGDPDFLMNGFDVSGEPRSWLVRFDGFIAEPDPNGPDRIKATFVALRINIPAFVRGTIDLLPPDDSGTERILVTGLTPVEVSTDVVEMTSLSTVYNRIGDTSFAPAFGQPFPNVHDSFTAWADYDGDGDQDAIVGGQTDAGPETGLYRNDAGTFTRDTNNPLPGLSNASASWGDRDGDGDPDLVLAGQSGAESLFLLFENEGGILTQRPIPSAPVLFHARAALRDLDGNGMAELLYMGGHLDPNLMRPDGLIWNADPTSPWQFGSHAKIEGLAMAQLYWKDLEGDGDIDLVVSGFDRPADPFGQRLRIFLNTGSSLVEVENFRGGIGLGVVWSDFDADGRLDLLLIGRQPDSWVRSLILL